MGSQVQNHGERAHALLSASGASRWLNCTPSARLEEKMPDKRSEYADEGTLAHELAEIKLRSLYKLHRKEKSTPEETTQRRDVVARIKEHPMYNAEMEEATDLYCNYVMEQFNAAKASDSSAMLMIEVKVNFGKYIEEGFEQGFGTCDAIIIANGTMDVIDMKYGKGVRVSANDNSQLKLYALGALDEYEFLYDVEMVQLHIVQPRLDAFSMYPLKAASLTAWGVEVVQPNAKKAYAGEGEQVSGDWCRFCKVKTHCRKLNDDAMEIAKNDFPDLMLLSDDEVLEAYKTSSKIISWLNSVADYVFQEALLGKPWEGFKLVEGRSNRQLADADAVEQVLRKEGFTEADFMTIKLKGIGDLEKLLGKKGFEEALGSFVVKPAGKPTLVPESDRRAAINTSASALADFDDLPEEDL